MRDVAKTRWTLVWLLWLAGLLAAAQFGKVSLTLAALAAAYPGAPEGVPFLVSMVSVVGLTLGPVAGGLVTRIGLRRSVLGALLVGAAMSWVQALLPPLPVMIVSRLIEGAAHLALVVSLPTLMAEAAAPRDRPVVMALWAAYFGVTFAALSLVLPSLLAWGGPGMVFALHGGGALLMAAALAPVLPRGLRAPARFRLGVELRAIYTTPRLIAPGAIFLWHAMAFIALLAFLPAMLAQPGIGAVLPLVSLAGTFGAGFLARRFAPARLAAAAFGAIALFCAAIIALPGLALPLAVAMFLFIGIVPAAGFAAIPWLNDDAVARARANGALAQMGNIGTFTGTPLMALLAGGSLGGLMAVALAIALAGLAVAVLVALRFRHG